MATRLDVVKEEPLYVNPDAGVSIFKGTISQGRIKVAIKEQVHTSPHSANFAIREALNHAQLVHDHICVMYDCYLTQSGSGDLKTVIVTELLDSDLEKETRNRKVSKAYWMETELLAFLEQVTSALAFAQEKGISHRDIKPQNIFFTNGVLKIGDFGSSARNMDLKEFANTLQGSPLFLSPELKRGYLNQINDKAYRMEPYDPFSSDVYSLGVTFLYLARLEPPMELSNLEQLKSATEGLVQKLGMPQLGHVLLEMLEEDAHNRISFNCLLQELQSYHGMDPSMAHSDARPNLYVHQPEIDPVYPPQHDFIALEESKAVSQVAQGRLDPNALFPQVPATDQSSGIGSKTCSSCCQHIVDVTWHSSLPKDLQGFQRLSSDFCSLKCLDEFAMNLRMNSKKLPYDYQGLLNYFNTKAQILKREGTRRWPYCNEKEKTGAIQSSVLHIFELLVRPVCESCRLKEYDLKLVQGGLTYLCSDCFQRVSAQRQ